MPSALIVTYLLSVDITIGIWDPFYQQGFKDLFFEELHIGEGRIASILLSGKSLQWVRLLKGKAKTY